MIVSSKLTIHMKLIPMVGWSEVPLYGGGLTLMIPWEVEDYLELSRDGQIIQVARKRAT